MSKKVLQELYPNSIVKKALFKDYNYTLIKDGITYFIKVLGVNRSTILSINSKHIWEIKRGKAVGISFKTSSKTYLDMRAFNELDNKIIVFKNQPYKILRYINESEVVDISDTTEIQGIKIYNSIKEITV